MENPQERAIVLMSDENLAHIPSTTISLIRSSIRLIVSSEDSERRDGSSFTDGNEFSPVSSAMFKNISLPLIMQINLAELSAFDDDHLLPSQGMLYVFFDMEVYLNSSPEVRSCHQILYVDAQLPMKDSGSRFIYYIEPTLPHYDHYDPSSLKRLGVAMALSDDAMYAYWEVQKDLRNHDENDPAIHRIFGYADPVQTANDDCDAYFANLLQKEEGVAELQEYPPWCLLLQVDSDPKLGTIWCDLGRIYFYILKSDLAKRDFSRTWVDFQGS